MTKRKEIDTINFSFNMFHLDNMIAMIIFSGYMDFSTTKSLNNLDSLIQMINEDNIDDDRELQSRLFVLRKLIRLRIDHNITDPQSLFDALEDGNQFEDDIQGIIDTVYDSYPNGELTEDEFIFIDEFVSDLLQYSFIFKYQDTLDDISMRLKMNEYDSLHDICEEFREHIEIINKKFIDAEAFNKDMLMDFNSNDNSFKTALSTSVTKLQKSSSTLHSGITFKNKMLGGGYQAGRFYLYVGLPGGFKSGELLNLAIDFKTLNKSVLNEDTSGEPVILFVTQENSIRETIERIWSYYMGDESSLKDYSIQEAWRIISEETDFTKGIPIIMKYRKSKTISTKDVENMIEELNNNGKRVICVIHDYLKRIHSQEKHDSMYEELGAVCDEFCNMAKYYDIPVISASQFNRSGYEKIEEAAKKSKSDPLKELTTSNIGESVRLVDNSDYIISIFRKPDPVTGSMFIAYNLLKQRGKPPKDQIPYFVHPFEENNSMKLKSDYGMAVSYSKVEMNDGTSNVNPSEYRSKRRAKINKPTVTKTSGGRPREKVKKMVEEESSDEE